MFIADDAEKFSMLMQLWAKFDDIESNEDNEGVVSLGTFSVEMAEPGDACPFLFSINTKLAAIGEEAMAQNEQRHHLRHNTFQVFDYHYGDQPLEILHQQVPSFC